MNESLAVSMELQRGNIMSESNRKSAIAFLNLVVAGKTARRMKRTSCRRCVITILSSQTDAIKANFPAGIARPALRALVAAGLRTLEQLTTISEVELSELHGMGPKAVKTLRAGLLAEGLDFRDPSEDS